MKKLLQPFIAILLFGFLCVEINQFAYSSQNDPDNLKSIVDANNQFALDLYAKYKTTQQGNIFFSPYSISTALAMVYEGARGQTAQEIANVFHFPIDANQRRQGIQALYNEINGLGKAYELKTANALWAEKTYKFLGEYTAVINTYYKGNVTNLNFIGDGEGSRETINSWVETQTNNKIKDLISPGGINPDTRLVLTNAVYFKGDWLSAFQKDLTKESPFKISDQEAINVATMTQTLDHSRYTENTDLQILELPYKGEELSMLILLPKTNNLSWLENNLTLENLSQWKNDLKGQKIIIYLPKFKFETKYSMAEDLNQMGMPTAFKEDGSADFSGMDGTKYLYISQVIHQAFVDVNEEGTEAAAATAVEMKVLSAIAEPDPIIFRADHPFIFIIQQQKTGNILFIGKIYNPKN